MKTNISMLVRERTMLLTNGMSSMLINGREIQERVNSTRDSVCMLIEISSLSHNFLDTDTSNKQIALIFLLSPETEENNKYGTSINNL
jgi:hypothetical protein